MTSQRPAWTRGVQGLAESPSHLPSHLSWVPHTCLGWGGPLLLLFFCWEHELEGLVTMSDD